MKSNFLGVVTISALALFSVAGSASALDRTVSVNNLTGSVMTEFYASNTGTNDWQEDILGDQVVGAGETATINIDDGSGYCKFDFKAVFDDGTEVISPDNNVCELTDFNITE
ncbi:hypothetical protein [Devosia aquimaris]|uniref:hypothetical protein n=1 Tax=Devosia aquimaris TaxID=2866214 RepID=UPI001CD0F50E|nr:hypothetical protein [Devosia sp. CJK-A8-3]